MTSKELEDLSEEECSLLLLEGLANGADKDKLQITKVFNEGKLIYALVFDIEENKKFFEIKTNEYPNIRIEKV